ncbi:uncharacterized protein LOC104903507 [Beta vulgaris subsp. vulgaris]|uniref:uncharacterized protein LOC104903507 n=1 Tax=Beta vulgaris subsp. vulgaris TaxID=3555 RepID=UPI002036EF78|nr:uncharacterized protein LOC104903507 [Beta vulgaris subsp. vulgaris]
MGNCVFKDYYNTTTTNSSTLLDYQKHPVTTMNKQTTTTTTTTTSMIKVVTTTGGIMELYAPITAEQITSEFPNHGIFLTPNPNTHPPLLHNDNLRPGLFYYLLPLTLSSSTTSINGVLTTPYRMSVDQVGTTTRMVYKTQPDPDVVRKYNGSGVWKVRLVINPEYLSEILSQDNKTQQLIESVRTVAKCGSGSVNTTSSSSSVGGCSNSDQCSVSSCNFHLKGSF